MITEEKFYCLNETHQLLPMGRIMREKGFGDDRTYDDLLGITDFTDLDQQNQIYGEGYHGVRGIESSRGLFFQPNIVVRVPERFEYCGFQDVLETYNIIFPQAESPFVNCSNAPVVHRKFIEVLTRNGFSNFRTYPVRVYFIKQFQDVYAPPYSMPYLFDTHDPHPRISSQEAMQRFPYDDEMYVMFQLTNAAIPLFDEEDRQRVIKEKAGTYWTPTELKLREDFDTLKFPLLFRFQYEPNFFCHASLKADLEQFNFLHFVEGSKMVQRFRK
jgi:hypothetical protein